MQLMEEGARPEPGGSGRTESVYEGIGGLGSDPERAEDKFPLKRLKPQNRPLSISPSPASASERGKAAKTRTAAPPSRPPSPDPGQSWTRFSKNAGGPAAAAPELHEDGRLRPALEGREDCPDRRQPQEATDSRVGSRGRDKEHSAGNSVPLLPGPPSWDRWCLPALGDPDGRCRHPQDAVRGHRCRPQARGGRRPTGRRAAGPCGLEDSVSCSGLPGEAGASPRSRRVRASGPRI